MCPPGGSSDCVTCELEICLPSFSLTPNVTLQAISSFVTNRAVDSKGCAWNWLFNTPDLVQCKTFVQTRFNGGCRRCHGQRRSVFVAGGEGVYVVRAGSGRRQNTPRVGCQDPRRTNRLPRWYPSSVRRNHPLPWPPAPLLRWDCVPEPVEDCDGFVGFLPRLVTACAPVVTKMRLVVSLLSQRARATAGATC